MSALKLCRLLALYMLLSSVGTSSGLQPQQTPRTTTIGTRSRTNTKRMMTRSARFENVDWQATLEEIASDIRPYLSEGEVASYIPALAQVDPNQFGIAFSDLQGNTYKAGPSADTPFSIQSISKVFALVMALDLEGDALWQRVGREPSGSRFNSIVQLENEQGRPRNPFINAGAIAVTNSIQQHYCNVVGCNFATSRILDFMKRCAQTNDDSIRIDPDVAKSEAEFGDRNRALAYFMRSYGVVQGDIGLTLDTYFHQCALEMSVVTLSRAGLFLAAAGRNPLVATEDEKSVVTSHEIVARVNSLMMLCGHYDMSGDFAFRVGLPGKSGVGGGILAIVPEVGSIAVWSPRLNSAGNSLAGTLALEWFSRRTGVNLF